jgi:hypothetical protein
LPSGANPFVNGTYKVAIAGSRCLVCGNGVMAYSDNRSAFKYLSFPNGIKDQQGYNSSVGGNGINRFFYAYANSAWIGGTYSNSIQLYSMQNNQTNWTARGTFNLPSNATTFYQPYISVAVNGSLLVMAIKSSSSVTGLLLTSIDGGNTWTANNSNPGIMSVAYGNGIFLGAGNGGVWKSTNGINWNQSSTTYVGNIIFSSQEGCFFSQQNGVSKDGTYWMPYGPGTYSGENDLGPISSGTGVIFSSLGQQLSSTFIPSFYASNPRLLNVGRASSFTLQLDTAGSGSISQ